MSVDLRREVQEVYRDLLDSIVPSRWAVSPEDKDIIDDYWDMVFKVSEDLTLNLNGTAPSSLQSFQEDVRTALPRLQKMKEDIAEGVIHNNDVASVLSERIKKALDASNRFLQIQPPR